MSFHFICRRTRYDQIETFLSLVFSSSGDVLQRFWNLVNETNILRLTYRIDLTLLFVLSFKEGFLNFVRHWRWTSVFFDWSHQISIWHVRWLNIPSWRPLLVSFKINSLILSHSNGRIQSFNPNEIFSKTHVYIFLIIITRHLFLIVQPSWHVLVFIWSWFWLSLLRLKHDIWRGYSCLL